MLEAFALIIVGLLTGALAAALGLGGGVIFVPALVVLFSFDQHLAQGTSLAVIVPTAVVATIAHARTGNVQWRLATPIAAAGLVGAVLGAQVALRLDADVLRRAFGVFLVILAVRMAWRAWRLNGRPAQEADPS
ncbi:MAG: sulfite exporter TauE/SafE family protein [Actinomycetota bacterium]